MLISQRYHVKMPKDYLKIWQLFAAYNQTFFFLGRKQEKQDCVAHVNSQGQILFQCPFNQYIESCAMLSDRQGIVLQTKANLISIIDLQTYRIDQYSHNFLLQQADQSNMITFQSTKLLCIEQKGRHGDNRYKLSYYYYPFRKQSHNRPCAVFQSIDNQWTVEYVTMKANNSSMICWWRPLEDKNIHFFTYQLKEGSKGFLNQYKVTLDVAFAGLGLKNIKSKLQIGVTHIWEIRQRVFLIIALTSLGNIQKKHPFTKFMIYDLNKKTVSQARFRFGMEQDCLVNCYNLGRSSIFLTFSEEDLQVRSSPLYYIDHRTESIISQSYWQCNNKTFFQFPGYENGLICESEHQLQKVGQFKMNIRKVMSARQMYIYLMHQTFPQLDEDLIIDTLRLIASCQDEQ